MGARVNLRVIRLAAVVRTERVLDEARVERETLLDKREVTPILRSRRVQDESRRAVQNVCAQVNARTVPGLRAGRVVHGGARIVRSQREA